MDIMQGFVNNFLLPGTGQSYNGGKKLHGRNLLWLKNKAGQNFPNIWIPKKARGVMLYSHGNGGSLSDWHMMLEAYAERFHISVFGVEYPGYGPAEGVPSEISVNDNVYTAYDFLISIGYPTANIILMGFSIGTGPTIKLAAELCSKNTPPGGVVTLAAFTSVLDIVHDLEGMYMLDMMAPLLIAEKWSSIQNVTGLTCPILLIHGLKDVLIPWQHSQRLFDNCPAIRKFIKLCPMADHCNYNEPTDSLHPIASFLSVEFNPRRFGYIEMKSVVFKCPLGANPAPGRATSSGGEVGCALDTKSVADAANWVVGVASDISGLWSHMCTQLSVIPVPPPASVSAAVPVQESSCGSSSGEAVTSEVVSLSCPSPTEGAKAADMQLSNVMLAKGSRPDTATVDDNVSDFEDAEDAH